MHTLASPQVNVRMINVITHALCTVVYREPGIRYGVGESNTSGDIKHQSKDYGGGGSRVDSRDAGNRILIRGF